MAITTYAQLNIGSNSASGSPMSQRDWHAFIEAASELLAHSARMVTDAETTVSLMDQVEVHLGVGRWEGQTEVSAKVSLFSDAGMDQDHLLTGARALARMWDQDAIAVIMGSTLAERVSI